MAELSLLKRTFRNVAVVAGLIERRQPGLERTARRKHKQHVPPSAIRAEAAVNGLIAEATG